MLFLSIRNENNIKTSLKTITTDNGLEFAALLTITKKLDAKVYFADTYSFGQKGCIKKCQQIY